MFDWLVPVSLRIVSRACRLPVRQDDIHMVQSLCSLCQASLHLLFGDRADTSQASPAPLWKTRQPSKYMRPQTLTITQKCIVTFPKANKRDCCEMYNPPQNNKQSKAERKTRRDVFLQWLQKT
jgi:hypothetical protein